MLAFTVKEGETVLIGNTKMKVMEVRGKQVRLSFDAPQDVHIVRESIITKDSGG